MLDLVTQYYNNPVNKRIMEDASISRHEGNSICGDDITVFIKIEESEEILKNVVEGRKKWVIKDRSYEGNTSMITTAASSFLSELISGRTVDECLTLTYENTLLPEWFQVTPRRKRAGAIAILATRNGLHEYLGDGKVDGWDDVVEI